ncbi:MAG: SdpI family protein [Cryobacterium sp.]|nr:SdpI family protein [Cryobacterium sp.]
MVMVAVVFPVLLLLTAVLTQLAGNGVLRRNRVAGIRVRSTLRSDSGWVAGHRAAAPWVWAGFVVSAAAGVSALLLDGAIALVFAVIVVAALGATVAVSLYVASRAARTADESALATS